MEVNKEAAIKAQKDDKCIKVTSNIYPRGLTFKPWEEHSSYFIGHSDIKYFII